MSQVKITASPKVGTIAFDHEGDLVVLTDGAVLTADAWAAAQKLEALAPHLARARVSATPIPVGEADHVADPDEFT